MTKQKPTVIPVKVQTEKPSKQYLLGVGIITKGKRTIYEVQYK